MINDLFYLISDTGVSEEKIRVQPVLRVGSNRTDIFAFGAEVLFGEKLF